MPILLLGRVIGRKVGKLLRSLLGLIAGRTYQRRENLFGLASGTGIAIISVGSVRSIMFRHKVDRDCQFEYPLPSGSLLYMSEQIQQEWLHAIPKIAGAQERVSLTFRSINK